CDPAGRLHFTDVPGDTIYRLDDNGKPEVFVRDAGRPGGMMFGPGGKRYCTQGAMRRIVASDLEGKLEVIASDVRSNDLVVTGKGGVYFTDPRAKRVWYVDPQRNKRVVDEGIERPNGIILWPDQGTLVVADTNSSSLWTFRIEKDGGLAHKQAYYTMRLTRDKAPQSGADGMTTDRDGRLYVATHAGLQVFDTQGRISGVISRPQKAFLSNVVFAGKGLQTLYVTSSDKVYRRKTKVRGLLFSSHQAPPAKP
ncbi:MAG: SMP-30/gluconolactonase/LRE family protein, partial [Planctomycetes bacterium]|nr:SMP-30/gluconolactonase/LRE family protein [Planctomycetota bacterium]